MKDRGARIAAWYRRLSPRAVDALIALLVYAEATLEIGTSSGTSSGKAWAQLVALGVAVAVLLRRRLPLSSLVLAMCSILAMSLLEKAVVDATSGPWLASLFVVFSFSLQTGDRRRLALGAAAALASGVLSALTDQYPTRPEDLVFVALLVVAAPFGAGQLIRGRIALNRALRAKLAAAEAERAVAAEAAAADERTRIAGELHDVVAHALGAMTVQASAARRLADRDHERAREAFRAVEETGREALTELRRLLGVLRREDDEIALAPQPRLANVGDLARRTRAAGLPVAVTVEGQAPASVPPGIDLTGYRLVQEALVEALERGRAGSAEVRVRYRPDGLEIEVVDDGRGGEERSLLGMRERVRVYGGHFATGPVDGGGHRIHARLPLEVPV